MTKQPRKLYRTDVTIWTEFPTHHLSLHQLGREAETGEGYCDARSCEIVTDSSQYPDTDFFAIPPLDETPEAEEGGEPQESETPIPSPDKVKPFIIEETPKPEFCQNCGKDDKFCSNINYDADYPYIQWICDGCGCVHD